MGCCRGHTHSSISTPAADSIHSSDSAPGQLTTKCSNAADAAHMAAAHTSSNVDAVSDVLTLVLHNQQHNALQDAETFSRLLCANKQLRSAMLGAAAARLTLSWPTAALAEHKHRSMALWLQQHLQLQTIKQLQLLQDLSQAPMHDFDAGAMQLDKCKQAFCSRVAGVLGSAAAFLGPQQQLPKISRWSGHGESASKDYPVLCGMSCPVGCAFNINCCKHAAGMHQ